MFAGCLGCCGVIPSSLGRKRSEVAGVQEYGLGGIEQNYVSNLLSPRTGGCRSPLITAVGAKVHSNTHRMYLLLPHTVPFPTGYSFHRSREHCVRRSTGTPLPIPGSLWTLVSQWDSGALSATSSAIALSIASAFDSIRTSGPEISVIVPGGIRSPA